MAKSEQQRQRKLAKKKSKERDNRKALAQRQQQLTSLAGRMEVASRYEIEGCYIANSCQEKGIGIGHVMVIRRSSSGQYIVVVFLVDAYCLGVKDTFARMFTASQMVEFKRESRLLSDYQSVSPGLARGYVEAAIAFARENGFAPHGDYRKVAPIWGDIQPTEVPKKYTFGSDGKPLYVAGPRDDAAFQMRVINTLSQTLGVDNAHFSIPSRELMDLNEDDSERLTRSMALGDDAVELSQTVVDGTVIGRIE